MLRKPATERRKGRARRAGRGGGTRSGVSRLAFSFAKGSFFIIVFALATGWAVSERLSLVVGLWVGFVLAWGAFRFFGWDRAAPKYVYLWGSLAGSLCWSSCLSNVARTSA